MKTALAVVLSMTCMGAWAQWGRPVDYFAGPSLKDAYKDYFTIGVAVNQNNISDPVQSEIVKKQFNSVTAENDWKPGEIHPKEGVWNFEKADKIANFCRENGIKMRGHCLCWHSQFADWMFTDKKGKEVKKEVFYERLREHIHTVVNRYKDVVYAWDVVNEAMADDNGFGGFGGFGRRGQAPDPYRQSRHYKLCGDEFIAKAFQFAREADPTGVLIYNDYSCVDNGKRERIYNMVKKMKDAGVPIDGIGMQGHYNIYFPDEDQLEKAIQRFSEIVNTIHITELDLRTNTESGGQLRFSRGEVKPQAPYIATLQEDQYNRLFKIFRKYKNVIKNVTFWNLSDKDSWLGLGNHPLPIDENFKAKRSFQVIRDFDPALDNAVPKEDFVPNPCNQPGQEWPQVNSEGYARFRVEAPDAKSVIVSLGLGGRGGTVLRKDKDGVWVGTTEGPMDPGFHYYHLTIDGGVFNDPGTHNYFGSCRWESGIEIPAPDQDDGKIKPFIVVMAYGLTNDFKFGTIGQFTAKEFETLLIDELIPVIDKQFLTKPDKWNRAMAGLSMGGMETKLITLRRPEVFGYWGLLSGGQYAPEEIKDPKCVKYIFEGCGSKENPDGINKSVESLKAAGFNAEGLVSEGTAHEFLTWRRCLEKMAQSLFK